MIPKQPVKIAHTEARSILSKTMLSGSDYAANPYTGCPHACKYCYATFMRRFTNHPEPWGTFLDVKAWPAVKNPHKYDGQRILIGTVTDPYNPFEARFERTRLLLEQLRGTTAHISILTKSDLVLRDLELIKWFPNCLVAFSINTVDEEFQREMDNAAPIHRRVEAMRSLHAAGITTAAFISPIFPGITDVPAICEATRGITNEVWLENLNLRGGYKGTILRFIERHHPELLALYREIYVHGNMSYWHALSAALEVYGRAQSIPMMNFFFHAENRKAPPSPGV